MYLVKTPHLIQSLMPAYTWRMPADDKVLYLTFDDGPIPEVTPWVLANLARYAARATFFCVGENVQRYGSLYHDVLAAGHSVGNHTYNHLNGWHTELLAYFHNVRRCARLVKSPLFRPPYGRLRPRQRLFLERHFRIIMWDVLSGDFDPHLSPEKCLANVLEHAGPGSIVVMHASLKAEPRLRHMLPRLLEHFAAQGYRFAAVPMEPRVRAQWQ